MSDDLSDMSPIYRDERLVMLRHRNLLLAGWMDAPLSPQMHAMERTGWAMEDHFEEGAALANVVFRGRPDFPPEVREQARRMTADPSTFSIGCCHTLLLGGFKGAAVSSFLNTVLLFGRPPHPTRIVSSLQAAERFLLPRLDAASTWDALELRGALAALAHQCDAPADVIPDLAKAA